MKVQNPPLDSKSILQMHHLWLSAFGDDFVSDVPDGVFYGEEEKWNSTNIYQHRVNNQTIATGILIRSLALPSLGGLGEVSTDPEYRGKGLATAICERLVGDFRNTEGRALFLGTVNPDAARIYERLGWRHIKGTKLMVNMSGFAEYDVFIREYFSDAVPATICEAKPSARIPLIPLIIFPHDWTILDSNISLYSTNVMTQLSCLGLYRRYDNLRSHQQGEWFTLLSEDEKVLGISSAAHKGEKRYQVDGFCHPYYEDFFVQLVQAAVNWCESMDAREIIINVLKEDIDKENLILNIEKDMNLGKLMKVVIN